MGKYFTRHDRRPSLKFIQLMQLQLYEIEDTGVVQLLSKKDGQARFLSLQSGAEIVMSEGGVDLIDIRKMA